MRRLARLTVLLLACLWAQAASAEVTLSFHSFNGSVLFGRYPHTFIVMRGTLDETGEAIDENYGFTAKRATMAVLRGPVVHDIMIEEPKYIDKTNRHFSVPISDAQYRAIVAEMRAWRDAPGKYYDLDTRNCIHFVGRIAEIVGLSVEYPDDMLRRPKKWLNHVTMLNPSLGARTID
ncbi:hypothetical protein GRI38_11095 [Altererythrobacter aurantiacus]|uniref:Permuted papain-like amidase enzyme, YaeF/YiiX, C92 family n=1 Tax=Parapontixanthobacter aurantiacus TaxID=1463599 RepID=A0A844ZHW6_9SPHN|nr:hypothetical protein [Parapontixanthobacter aurantiacus]MXO86570.1 hypothetical protein [Parapontixanthobacter aurantiacus]